MGTLPPCVAPVVRPALDDERSWLQVFPPPRRPAVPNESPFPLGISALATLAQACLTRYPDTRETSQSGEGAGPLALVGGAVALFLLWPLSPGLAVLGVLGVAVVWFVWRCVGTDTTVETILEGEFIRVRTTQRRRREERLVARLQVEQTVLAVPRRDAGFVVTIRLTDGSWLEVARCFTLSQAEAQSDRHRKWVEFGAIEDTSPEARAA